MARKLVTIAALAASLASAVLPSAAMAHDRYRGDWDRGGSYYQDDDDWGRRDDNYRYDRGRYDDDRGYYADSGYYPRDYHRRYHGYRCHRDGSTGAILGALAGGLIGDGIAGRGDRTLGAILGGGAGALAGRAIERSGNTC